MEADDNGEWGQQTTYTTQFRQYDPSIGRWFSTDPIPKPHESVYAWNSNNTILIIDPSGADSIFYNQSGRQIRRVPMEGRHSYFLQHDDGNLIIGDGKYYQGNSYWSFFGDSARPEDRLFDRVDSETFPSLSMLEELVNKVHDGEGYTRIWANSGGGDKFDYKKNKELFGENEYTAYLIDGILYNRNEMGMFLWGGAIGKTGVPYSKLVQWNNAFHAIVEGNPDEWNEVVTWTTGWYMMKYGNYDAQAIENFLYFERWSGSSGSFLPYKLNPMLRGGDPTGTRNFETELRMPNIGQTGISKLLDMSIQTIYGQFRIGPSDDEVQDHLNR